jgi:predicted metal-dependent HD superfamily phosphohydrolase
VHFALKRERQSEKLEKTPMENLAMRRNWHELLRVWSVDPVLVEREFEDVSRHYAGPGRFYHTLDHVQNVLETIESLRSHAQNLNAVQLAAWLHDLIYDSKASDNEERSAELAQNLSKRLSIPKGDVVAALILKTKTHVAGDDPDAKVLIDADLAILGASEPEYRKFAASIRKEYAWVPDADFRMGRRRVLESFLARPTIYHLLGHLEEKARRNLSAEIAQLAPA